MRKLWLLFAFVALLGVTPSIFSFGAVSSTGSTQAPITMSATPVPGDEFVGCLFQAAGVSSPGLNGTWTLIGNQGTFTHCYDRAVVSGDASSQIVTFLTSGGATTNTSAFMYEVSSFNATDGYVSSQSTSTSSLTTSNTLTPTYNADILLAFAFVHLTGTTLSAPTYTQCSGFSSDTSASAGGATDREDVRGGNKTSVSIGTTCAPLYTTGGGTISGARTTGVLIGIQGGSPLSAPCLLGLLC